MTSLLNEREIALRLTVTDWLYITPFSRFVLHAGDTEDVFST